MAVAGVLTAPHRARSGDRPEPPKFLRRYPNFIRNPAFHDEIALAALKLGGTVTAEHGVGIGKRKYMEEEHGRSLAVMQTIKQALDPNGILNPGKIFETPG